MPVALEQFATSTSAMCIGGDKIELDVGVKQGGLEMTKLKCIFGLDTGKENDADLYVLHMQYLVCLF